MTTTMTTTTTTKEYGASLGAELKESSTSETPTLSGYNLDTINWYTVVDAASTFIFV